MANQEQLRILKQGFKVWNKWREENPDIQIDLSEATIYNADLYRVDLNDANLTKISLHKANLVEANLRGSNLTKAHLSGADFFQADLTGAILKEAFLFEADLIDTNLSLSDLTGATLALSSLINTKVDKAKVSGSWVYGINVWDLVGEFAEQKDLVITREGQPVITVDNIKVAQFMFLILNNPEIRDVINTLSSKTVLILGRFSVPERKAILDTLKDKLREYNLIPIVFDFERPTDRDFTETIKTLAGPAYFVIADITNPKSSPLELQATIPDYQIPFVPIIQEGEQPFAMMQNLQTKYKDWVLDTVTYDSTVTLIKVLKPLIVEPAMKKHNELRLIIAQQPDIISGKEFLKEAK